MKVAILGKFLKSEPSHYITKLVSLLKKRKVSIFLEEEYYSQLKELLPENINSFTELDKSYDLLISIGGDGTILKAITFVKHLSIPIVGINSGRLGFLAKIKIDKIEEAIDEIISGNYSISERSLIEVVTSEKNNELSKLNFALNEIAVSRKNTTSMISIETKLDDKYLNSYWADGLIIATPTGSTGYSLSCGGPIIMPGTNNIIITPNAPHNLNVRPIVIGDNSVIKLKVEDRDQLAMVSLDSRSRAFDSDTELTIQKAKFKTKLIQPQNNSFTSTIRNKLMWGLDKRS